MNDFEESAKKLFGEDIIFIKDSDLLPSSFNKINSYCNKTTFSLNPYVALTMAKALNIDLETFIFNHTEIEVGKNKATLLELNINSVDNGKCIFAKGNTCILGKDKPLACATLPAVSIKRHNGSVWDIGYIRFKNEPRNIIGEPTTFKKIKEYFNVEEKEDQAKKYNSVMLDIFNTFDFKKMNAEELTDLSAFIYSILFSNANDFNGIDKNLETVKEILKRAKELIPQYCK